MTGSVSVYGLPRSHWHCQLENFDWGSHPKQQEAVQKFMREILRGIPGMPVPGLAPHLYLYGPPGTGKTHLSVAMYRALIYKLGLGTAVWLNVPDFCDRVKQCFSDEEAPDPFERVVAARSLVVLDDLFAREHTQFEMEHIIFRLIDQAYRGDAALVVTSNLALEDLEVKLKRRELSRLLQNCKVLKLAGQDRRL